MFVALVILQYYYYSYMACTTGRRVEVEENMGFIKVWSRRAFRFSTQTKCMQGTVTFNFVLLVKILKAAG